jgi:hypothetical protein
MDRVAKGAALPGWGRTIAAYDRLSSTPRHCRVAEGDAGKLDRELLRFVLEHRDGGDDRIDSLWQAAQLRFPLIVNLRRSVRIMEPGAWSFVANSTISHAGERVRVRARLRANLRAARILPVFL